MKSCTGKIGATTVVHIRGMLCAYATPAAAKHAPAQAV